MRTQQCARVSCNCGIVVKEGDDVLYINMCGKHASPEIRYLSNREPQKGTHIEQSPNGNTFIVSKIILLVMRLVGDRKRNYMGR